MALMKATFKHEEHDAKMIVEYDCSLSHDDLDIWDDCWKLIELIDITPMPEPEPELEPEPYEPMPEEV